MQETPDPRHDRHVAFPDEATEQLPESWWAPAPVRTPPPPARPPALPPTRRASERRYGWWAVGAVAMVGFLMSGHSVSSGSFLDDTSFAEASQMPEITSLPAEDLLPIQPTDVPTFGAPQGTTVYRLEVVGSEPAASLTVVADNEGVPTDAVDLPFAAQISVRVPNSLEWVTVHASSGEHEIQCRLYAGEDLVAIDTGTGVVECSLPGPP